MSAIIYHDVLMVLSIINQTPDEENINFPGNKKVLKFCVIANIFKSSHF